MIVLSDNSIKEISHWSLKLKYDLNFILNNIKVGSRRQFKSRAEKLSKALPEILSHLSNSDAKLIEQKGLNALNDLQLWSRLESATEKAGNHANTSSKSKISSDLTIFIGFAMRNFKVGNKEILRPSMVKVEGENNAVITPLYRISVDLMWEFKKIANDILGDHSSPYHVQRTTRDAASAIAVIAEDPQVYNILLKSGITALSGEKGLINKALSNEKLKKGEKKALIYIFRRLSPENFSPIYLTKIDEGKQYWLNIGNTKINVTRLGRVAPILVKQAQEYANHYIGKKLTDDIEPKTAKEVPAHIRNFINLGRTFHIHKESLNSAQINILKSDGFKGFLANNGELLLWFSELKEKVITQRERRDAISSYSPLYSCVKYFSETNLDIRDYSPDYYIKTPSETAIGEYDYIEIGDLFNTYPALARDLKTVYLSTRNSLKADALDNVTILSRISHFQRVMKFPVNLSNEQREWLSNEGLSGFVKGNHSVLKVYLEYLQVKAKAGKYSPVTADSYQRGLKWVIEAAGFDVIDVYPVKVTQYKLYDQRDDSDTDYTKEEVIELAYHIEVLLAQGNLNQRNTLYLRIARILLKTGWNQSPVLTLETTDIVEVNCPIAGQKTYFVRLLKKRAGYLTQWHKFDLTANELADEGIEVGKSIKAVIKELLYLATTISEPIRRTLPADHPFKNKLMIYVGDDGVINLATNKELYHYVNKLLIKAGCSVGFGSRKIRKTGLNFLYRRVEKDFAKYKKSGQHSFEVFQRSYLRFIAGESKRTLSKAITVMGDYFHGRPITDNIKIVTESSEYWQQVPNGGCASQGNDAQAAAYNRQTHGLIKRFGLEKAKYCADFSACLWCEHYRCVADPEHAWRLLSYRDFVLEDMAASIDDVAEVGAQKEYHRLLTQRVNDILIDLDKLTSGCREAGEKLLAERGIHPDWKLASTTSDIFRES
ncbi:hypothetical protein [Photobacterium chitinilyticum]|uniref:Uncharacterized protein n=1 Tax=Photobacterium chitinilyticum TaxID=2485123 RepID=A0A3S3T1Y7_9GAMM|nr:hypothetical protein [Photobacterium chitinilyticum]RWX57318.1 hypothetical protein EDI28_04620 [Photobacterium chitinilyticum]